jgi:broad specificity phosphatase PhoE
MSVDARRLVLVKHAQPVLDSAVPARFWRLGPEGEEQSHRLAETLEQFLPLALVCSSEPKASRTAEIVAAHLGVRMRTIDGLEELDRPSLPLMSAEEHERFNASIFLERSRAVLGTESADQALARFSAAMATAIDETPHDHNLVVIAHGTVISLFVSKYKVVDSFELWKTLRCASFVELALPSFSRLKRRDY